MTRPDLTDLRERARAWFEALRDRLCAAFEQLEADYRGPESDRLAPGRFVRRPWDRAEGGGGVMALLRGRAFEKVGVNVSTVWGEFAARVRGADPRRRAGRALLGERHLRW